MKFDNTQFEPACWEADSFLHRWRGSESRALNVGVPFTVIPLLGKYPKEIIKRCSQGFGTKNMHGKAIIEKNRKGLTCLPGGAISTNPPASLWWMGRIQPCGRPGGKCLLGTYFALGTCLGKQNRKVPSRPRRKMHSLNSYSRKTSLRSFTLCFLRGSRLHTLSPPTLSSPAISSYQIRIFFPSVALPRRSLHSFSKADPKARR